MESLGKILPVAACVGFLCSPANAESLSNDSGILPLKDGAPAYWAVTLGGYGAAEPSFPGSKNYSFAFRPIFDIRRAGEPEHLNLPTDAWSLAFVDLGYFRAGLAGDFLNSRDHSDDHALRGLRDVDFSVELGGFVEYWPVPFVRTRLEILQAVTGNDGLIANLEADYVYRPNPLWQFTLGPRAEFANTQFESTYFSVNEIESLRSGLPEFHASGGLLSAGLVGSARYNLSDRLSVRAFAEWQRLLGDAADSPIVKLRGSEDQFEIGIGAAYTFNFAW